jgi:pseudouridine kinase
MHADRLGISLKNSLTVAGASTSSYLCINNERGDMQLAINDMTICAQLTPDYFAGLMPQINASDLLLIEANLPEETIVYLAEHATIPVLAEAVSVAKAVRLKHILSSLWLLKGNRLEVEVLSGVAIVTRDDLDHAADILLASGLKHLFVTLGDEGVFYAGQVEPWFVMPAIKPPRLINTTGCGDAFLAAVAWGVSQHFDMEINARLGLAAASICLESPSAVSEQLTVDLLVERSGHSLAKEEKG